MDGGERVPVRTKTIVDARKRNPKRGKRIEDYTGQVVFCIYFWVWLVYSLTNEDVRWLTKKVARSRTCDVGFLKIWSPS
jgi:hypothetical protein